MAFTTKSIIPPHTSKPDFNGDGFTDLVWQGADGTLAAWNMSQDGLTGQAGLYAPSFGGGLILRGIGDLRSDGTTDLVWQSAAGHVVLWGVKDNMVTGSTELFKTSPIQAVGDFNGDRLLDLLTDAGGGTWFTSQTDERKIPPLGLGTLTVDPEYQITGVGDFNGDGRDDILFRGTGSHSGTFLLHEMTGARPTGPDMPTQTTTFGDPGQNWAVLGLADFNGDGRTDILWQHTNGAGQVDARSMWLMNGGSFIGGGMVANPGSDWSVVGVDDYNNDGKADLMWKHTTGWVAEWLMNGANVMAFGGSFLNPGDFWSLGAI
jgi:hypothetical protein